MRTSTVLILAGLLAVFPASIPAQASPRSMHAGVPSRPAQEMVQTLESMSLLLNSVSNRSTAENAAPRLAQLHKAYKQQQNHAENMPPMSDSMLSRHLEKMDRAMNNFRMACARLMQEKFYGSNQLRGTVRKIAQDF